MSNESALEQSLGNLAEVARPRDEVRARIQRECRPKRAVRRRSRRERMLGTVFVLGGGMLLYLALSRHMQGFDDADSERAGPGWLGAGGWVVAFATALFFGLYQAPGRRSSRRARSALVVLLLLGLFTSLASLSTRFLPSMVATPFTDLLRCGSSATLAGGIVSLGMLLVWRRTDPFDPGVTGALVGLLGGLAGALTLGEVCPNHEAWHLLLGHGSAALFVTLLGMLVGRRWLAP